MNLLFNLKTPEAPKCSSQQPSRMPYISNSTIWIVGLLAATMITLVGDLVRRFFLREGKIIPTRWNPLLKSKKKLSNRDLPPELMDMILTSLSPLSQPCLALSCRQFYWQFKLVVKSPIFRFPYSHNLYKSVDINLRTEILLRLGSRDGSTSAECWTYCAACLKLHPKREFNKYQISEQPGEHYCEWPSIVVLCPDLEINPKKMMQIRNYLQTSPYFNSRKPDIKNMCLSGMNARSLV